MANTSAFDENAKQYDDWFVRHPMEYRLELAALRKVFPKTGQGIEIGAGTGRFMGPLKIGLGVEPSAAMRRIAVMRGLRMLDGVAEQLAMEDAAFDCALFVTTDCFLDDPLAAYREAARILKPHGSLIIAFIDRASPLGETYNQKKTGNPFYKDASFHSAKEIQSQLTQAGFTIAETVQTLMPGYENQSAEQAIKPGYGEGLFVVMKAQKSSPADPPG